MWTSPRASVVKWHLGFVGKLAYKERRRARKAARIYVSFVVADKVAVGIMSPTRRASIHEPHSSYLPCLPFHSLLPHFPLAQERWIVASRLLNPSSAASVADSYLTVDPWLSIECHQTCHGRLRWQPGQRTGCPATTSTILTVLNKAVNSK